jgi:NAD(P)-dependent dehydrogenase (short-subunit alcohol dehydrogenase family)
MPPRMLSPSGQEIQFATNHLGHFALTGLLIDGMLNRPGARIVTVSAGYHRQGAIHFDDLTGERSYAPLKYYAQSKFANVLFGLELDRRLRASHAKALSVLAHPGYAVTNLQSTGPTGLARVLFGIGNIVIAQSAEAGALSQLYAATDPAIAGGEFIGPDGPGEHRGRPKVVAPAAAAQDPELARRLWSLSETLTGVTFRLAQS